MKFTPDEQKAICDAARAVWNDCAYDILTAVAEEKGKTIDEVSVSRAVAIEIALDAGRAEDRLREQQRRDRKANRPSIVTDDLLERMNRAPYSQLIRIVSPVFPFAYYGT